jgi:antitoxin component YwqK of YwqJK toxin-antitoxin module
MKEVIELYDNNQVKEKGYLDSKGKQGKWLYYYENGSLFKEVEYLNDIENGIFLRYFDNGQMAYKSNFMHGKHTGPGIEFYENGNIKEEWIYKNEEFFPINSWNEKGIQTMKNGTGYKIEKYSFNIDKVYFENGRFIKRVEISRSEYLGFNSENE